jgi:raffinose/stachyose/melibiose transport system permease protein
VPEELSEAARVDGASHRQTFFRITLPLLVPAIGTVSVLTFIFAMEAFALPYAFGGSTGNPAGATDFISLLFYRTAFDSGATDAIGTSSALATLLFVVIFGGALAATAVLRRHDRRITG